MVCLDQRSITIGIHPHTGFAFAPRFASDDKEEALERCKGQMRHFQPLLLPQPCQSQAHRDNDKTVPNPCFLSPQTVYVRVRITYLFHRPLHRSLLCPFIAYQHDKKTPIHLLAAGLTMSIRSLPSRQGDAHTSSCRRSNYEWIRSGPLKSKDHACRLVYHRALTR